MAFYKKRDHVEIIAEILGLCKNPQTETCIRRQTSISYAVLQSCILQLLVNRWLRVMKDQSGLKKLVVTDKGLVFLKKYVELQQIIGAKGAGRLAMRHLTVQTKILQSA